MNTDEHGWEARIARILTNFDRRKRRQRRGDRIMGKAGRGRFALCSPTDESRGRSLTDQPKQPEVPRTYLDGFLIAFSFILGSTSFSKSLMSGACLSTSLRSSLAS